MDKSTDLGFGQLGSAYNDMGGMIIPPMGKVIVAITFLELTTPTVLQPELLSTGSAGPSFMSIASAANQTLANADSDQNFNGVHVSAITDVTYTSDGASGETLTLTVPAPVGTVFPGQYVMLANTAGENDGSTLLAFDTHNQQGCPIPIYNGHNMKGVRVASHPTTTTVTLTHPISATSQSLIFLDENHGAGGLTAAGQTFPKGLTIYGRWSAFQAGATGVICYFGN
jgi:hypothetical protein